MWAGNNVLTYTTANEAVSELMSLQDDSFVTKTLQGGDIHELQREPGID